MADELILDMTRKEATETLQFIRDSEGRKRIAIYVLRERNGWKSLGFNSFDAFLEDQIDTPRRTVYDWLSQVESTRHALGITLKDLCDYRTNEKGTLLPVTVSNELRKLKSSDERREVWKQFETITEQGGAADHGVRRDLTRQLKALVSQKLRLRGGSPLAESMPAPSTFDKAAEEKAVVVTPAPPPATPTTKTPTTPTPTTVKTFTPPPDPEPAEPKELFSLDYKEAIEALQTVLTWMENEETDGDSGNMKWAIGSLCEISQWIEARL